MDEARRVLEDLCRLLAEVEHPLVEDGRTVPAIVASIEPSLEHSWSIH